MDDVFPIMQHFQAWVRNSSSFCVWGDLCAAVNAVGGVCEMLHNTISWKNYRHATMPSVSMKCTMLCHAVIGRVCKVLVSLRFLVFSFFFLPVFSLRFLVFPFVSFRVVFLLSLTTRCVFCFPPPRSLSSYRSSFTPLTTGLHWRSSGPFNRFRGTCT